MTILDRTKQLLGKIKKPPRNDSMNEEKGMEMDEATETVKEIPEGASSRTYTEEEYRKELEKAEADIQDLAAQEAALAAEKEAFEKTKAEWDKKLTEARAVIFNADVDGVAEKYRVNADDLRKHVATLGLIEIAKVEILAEMLPKTPVFGHFDSGTGVSGMDFSLLTPEEKYARGVEEERRRMGR